MGEGAKLGERVRECVVGVGVGEGGQPSGWISHSAAPGAAPSSEALHCWVRAHGLPRWTEVQRPRARRCTVGCGAGVAGATQKGQGCEIVSHPVHSVNLFRFQVKIVKFA